MNDFDDNFGGPAEGDYIDPYLFDAHLDPYIFSGLAVLAVLVVIVCLAGYYLGRATTVRRLQAERKASREYIFAHVRYALDKALNSSGAVILERGREVADILEARLGLLLVLHAKLGKSVAVLRGALDPKRPDPPKPADVKAPRGTYNHAFETWEALQELSVFWQKDTVEALLKTAQAELSTLPVVPAVERSYFKWERKPASAKSVVAGALNDADKAGTAPVAVDPLPVKAEDAVTPDPTPTPPPPPPPAPSPKRKGGKLPAHKRNMLA